MNIDIEVSGRIRRVELERDTAAHSSSASGGPAKAGSCTESGEGRRAKTGPYLATIDGRPLAVDAVRTASGWSLLIDGASFEATVDGKTVYVNGQAVPVRVLDPRTYRRRVRGQAGGATAGPVEVRAPMPGRVVKLLVQIGERVAARQGIVVVEAMKMENELRAPRDGVVRDIRAHEGTSVDAGAILVIIE